MLAGGAVGAGALSLSCSIWGEDCGFAGLGGAFVGGLLGLASAFPYGAYKFGIDDQHTASLGWTYLSTLLGATAGFGGVAIFTRLDSEDAWFTAGIAGLFGAPVGALIGFNATRKAHPAIPQAMVQPLLHGGIAGRLAWRF